MSVMERGPGGLRQHGLVTPEQQPAPSQPAPDRTARVSVILDPPQQETLELRNAVQTIDAGTPYAQLSGLPHGWLVAEVKVPGLHRWGLLDGPQERLVLQDGDAEVLVQRGIDGFACSAGESEPPPPPGRTCWRVDVRKAAPGSFTWSSQLDHGRVVTFTLVLLRVTTPSAQIA
jgi:hypothetical protein